MYRLSFVGHDIRMGTAQAASKASEMLGMAYMDAPVITANRAGQTLPDVRCVIARHMGSWFSHDNLCFTSLHGFKPHGIVVCYDMFPQGEYFYNTKTVRCSFSDTIDSIELYCEKRGVELLAIALDGRTQQSDEECLCSEIAEQYGKLTYVPTTINDANVQFTTMLLAKIGEHV